MLRSPTTKNGCDCLGCSTYRTFSALSEIFKRIIVSGIVRSFIHAPNYLHLNNNRVRIVYRSDRAA
jgi:hypothetical protein